LKLVMNIRLTAFAWSVATSGRAAAPLPALKRYAMTANTAGLW
jgi:hypothetical protein